MLGGRVKGLLVVTGVDQRHEERFVDAASELTGRNHCRHERADVGELRECIASPQRPGLPEELTSPSRVGCAGGSEELPSLGQVGAIGAEVEAVATAHALEPIRGSAQVATQPGHMALQRRPGCVGEFVPPESVEERFARGSPSTGCGQDREQRPALRARHDHLVAIDDQSQRAEHIDSDLHGHILAVRSRASAVQGTSGTLQPMTQIDAGQPLSASDEAAMVENLRASLRGTVIDRGDPGYDEARRVWNGLIDRHPAAVARCRDVADVVEAVRVARRYGPPLSVRGGGHQVAGSGVCDDGLVIDLSAMCAVQVDVAARTARVQAGATWSDVDRATQVHGLATTGGEVSATPNEATDRYVPTTSELSQNVRGERLPNSVADAWPECRSERSDASRALPLSVTAAGHGARPPPGGMGWCDAVRMLVIDAPNMMGSRPTGWWRDRPGAGRRLTERVAAGGWTGP